MSPGYYDAVVGACRSAGFEPEIDEHGAGSTVWGYISQGRGIGLIVSSLIEQLPRGVELVDLAPPRPMLTINAVWRRDDDGPRSSAFSKPPSNWPRNATGASAQRRRCSCRCRPLPVHG
jgi:DNA-binding transcriptional LysR family regulator